MQEDNVALSAAIMIDQTTNWHIGTAKDSLRGSAGSARVAVRGDEGSVDVVEGVGPSFTDIVDFGESLERSVGEGVRGLRGGVRVRANTGGVVDHVLTHDVVLSVNALLLSPAVQRFLV